MRTISDTDLDGRMAFDNPWWQDAAPEPAGPPVRPQFTAVLEALASAGSPLVLAGPAGTGKGALLRQAARALIQAGTPAASILYWSAATPGSTGAADIAARFAERHGHGPESGIFLLFDEAQYLAGGPAALAELARAYPAARIAGAVSAMAPALVTGDQAGGIGVIAVPPLSFAEFLSRRGLEAALFTPGAGPVTLDRDGLETLNAEFTHYLNFGGFADGVAQDDAPGAMGAPDPAFVRDRVIGRVLRRDLAAEAGINDVAELARLFQLLALNTGSEVSMEELAKAVGIAKNTVRKYVDFLEAAFLIRRLPRLDRHANPFQRAVAFKVHLTAPCLFAALFGPVGPEDEAYARLAETALVAQWLGRADMARVAYASWRGGAVDLLTLDARTNRPGRVYEIDWNAAYEPGGPRAETGPKELIRFAESTGAPARAYVLTRRAAYAATLGGFPVTMAPVSLYAYWLGRERAGA